MSGVAPSGLALALMLVASPALAGDARTRGIDLTLHYGWDGYDAVALQSGPGGPSASSRLQHLSTTVGGTAIHWRGMGEFGAIGEVGRSGRTSGTTLLGLLGGLGFDLGAFRLEALGELGAHRYGEVFKDPAVASRSPPTWLVSLGLRPGLALHFGPQGSLLVGVWAFARWDVTRQHVQVNLASGGTSTYKLGGSQFGASLRVGISL
jgi:hypothetical protein